MRIIKYCHFNIGTKIPFSTLPEIVHQYLANLGLKSHRFMYYFSDTVSSDPMLQMVWRKGGCDKAYKDCPSFGTPRYLDTEDFGFGSGGEKILSNIDGQEGCTEDEILPLMKKIHRSYGFTETNLYYFDVDFFHDLLPFWRDFSSAQKHCDHYKKELEPLLFLSQQPKGSGIHLYRDFMGKGGITISVDVLHDGKVLDATPYFDAMKALLPKICCNETMVAYLTPEEQKDVNERNIQAAPLLNECGAFLKRRLPSNEPDHCIFGNYKIAEKIKSLGKKYGYQYKFLADSLFALTKRTHGGHSFTLLVESGPSRTVISFAFKFQGLGFEHYLYVVSRYPSNQEEFDQCAEQVMAAVTEFEREKLPLLDAFYPETPEWFVPSL